MVQRMTPPGAISATALSAEVGVGQPTLSRWLREAASVDVVAKLKRTKPKLRAIASVFGPIELAHSTMPSAPAAWRR